MSSSSADPAPISAPNPFSGPAFAATMALVAINVITFIGQAMGSLSLFDPGPEALLANGGNLALLSLVDEPWRLFTSLFVHAGLLHLATNMVMLTVLGLQAGRRFKVEGLLAIYLCGGVAASLVSAWWSGLHVLTTAPRLTPFGLVQASQFSLVVSAGASGALMALCGALAALAMRQSMSTTGMAYAEEPVFSANLWKVIGLNLVLGFFIQGVDQAAHVGGLLAGFAMGLVIASLNPDQGRMVHAMRVALGSALMAGAVWAALPPARTPELMAARTQWDLDHGVDRKAEAKAQARAQAREKAEREAAAEVARLPGPVPAEQAMGTVLKVGDSGAAMALSADEHQAVVVDRLRNAVHVVDLDGGQVTRVIKGPARSRTSGQGAAGVALLGGSDQALVSALASPRSISLVDLQKGTVLRSLDVGREPQALAVSPDRSRALVHNTGDRSLSIVDLAAWKVLKTWPIKSMDSQLWFSPDGARFFVHSVENMQIETYDAATLEMLDYQIPDIRIYRAMPHRLPDKLVTMSRFELMQMDIHHLYSEKFQSFCEPQHGADFTAVHDAQGRTLVAVAMEEESAVRIGNFDNGATLGQYPLPSPPAQLQFSKDGSRLFALGRGGTLSVIDPRQRLEAAPALFCRESKPQE